MSRDRSPRPREYAPNSSKVFIGNLDERTTKNDLEDFFRKSGTLTKLWIARQPPGFGFVEFEDARDAEDACRECNGRELLGKPVRVEMSGGQSRGPPRGGSRDECFNCGELGHFARDCPSKRGYGGRDRDRDRRRRSYSRSPPRRRDRDSRDRDRDHSRSRSRGRRRSPPRRRSNSPRRRSYSR